MIPLEIKCRECGFAYSRQGLNCPRCGLHVTSESRMTRATGEFLAAGYQPACQACRDNAATYYKACQGCQERRRKAMEDWHKLPGFPAQPAASVDGSRDSSG